MPRKKKNARSLDKPKRFKTKVDIPKVVLLPVRNYFDDISPGVLRAAAEWRG